MDVREVAKVIATRRQREQAAVRHDGARAPVDAHAVDARRGSAPKAEPPGNADLT